MTLEERIRRNDPQDQIEIGEIVERATSGEFGNLLKLIINGIVAEELMHSREKNNIPAERALGRIEALSLLQERLDLCVEIKNKLTEEQKESEKITNA